MKMTPTRLKVLRFLAAYPDGYHAKTVIAECCPRPLCFGRQLHYTEQGLARMTGAVLRPLHDAGLVKADWRDPMHSMLAQLTPAGRELLAERDKAASDAERDAAIESGN